MSELESKTAEYESKKAHLEEQVASASVGREESKEREQLLHSLQEKTEERQKMVAELDKYKACDPDRMKELRKYILCTLLASSPGSILMHVQKKVKI